MRRPRNEPEARNAKCACADFICDLLYAARPLHSDWRDLKLTCLMLSIHVVWLAQIEEGYEDHHVNNEALLNCKSTCKLTVAQQICGQTFCICILGTLTCRGCFYIEQCRPHFTINRTMSFILSLCLNHKLSKTQIGLISLVVSTRACMKIQQYFWLEKLLIKSYSLFWVWLKREEKWRC